MIALKASGVALSVARELMGQVRIVLEQIDLDPFSPISLPQIRVPSHFAMAIRTRQSRMLV
jgi:hypothetical protein